MTVMEMMWAELRGFRRETSDRLKSIETEVRRTNGRVTALERLKSDKPDPRAPWYSDIHRQWWFPWLIAFLVTYIGPKAAMDIFNSIIAIFKH